jgi:rhodanese-related sulfurtransferase/thioredoxin-related protein
MSDASRVRINVLANVILAVAVAVFLFTFGWQMVRERLSMVSASQKGNRIEISGIKFSESDQTLLLVLNKDCKFCQQETPFYHSLSTQARTKRVGFIVAFQDDIEQGRKYLSDGNIVASNIIRVRLDSINVEGTPTLFLLNKDGEIVGKWAGTLSEAAHDYIIGILGVDEGTIRKGNSPFLMLGNLSLPPSLKADEFRNKLKNGDVILLDVDARKDFAREHIEDAMNLPEDEVYARSLNEVDSSKLIVLFSRDRQSPNISNAFVSLKRAGFGRIGWLKQSIEECKAAGLPVQSR